MKAKHCTLVLAASLFLFACQKEMSIERGPSSPSTNDSTVLSMFIQLDTLSGSVDTSSKTIFEYDNLKRLTDYKTTLYFNNLPSLSAINERGYYYYNGTDTLPYKTVIVYLDSTGTGDLSVDSSVSFITRNTNQQITRDSTYYLQFTRSLGAGSGSIHIYLSNFSIYSDSVIEDFKETDIIAGNVSTVTGKGRYVQTRLNGNLITEVYSILEATGYRDILSAAYSYDDKVNPLKIYSTNYPVSQNINFSANDYLYKNNFVQIVSVNYTSIPSSSSTTKYSYIYNTLGLPKTVVSYDPADPLSAVKGIFIYTN